MDDILAALAGFTQQFAKAEQDGAFQALQVLCDRLAGVRLFTCTTLDMTAGQACRIHTSDPEAYPLTGMKEIEPNRWTETVLDRREMFVANSVSGFRDVFPDHAKIAAMGLGSVVNMPVLAQGKLLGTVNLLHEAGHYGREQLAALGHAQLPAAAAFLAHGG